ncbi:MAG: hypothetical protein Q4G19_02345 [Clostridia bacterium]|nr:hypothetical protein [Clostridia bacterium]
MLQKIKNAIIRFMNGRYGLDNLGQFTLLTGLAVSILSSILQSSLLSLIGFALYVITLFRMFSKNRDKRRQENIKYMDITGNIRPKIRRIFGNVKTRVSQFIKRLKNSKEYKYFRCPGCKVLLRKKRSSEKKEITCVRCGHKFVK